MMEKTSCVPNASSSTSVSRNPPATSNPRIVSLASINEVGLKSLGWSEQRVFKIQSDDASLLDDIEPKDIVMVAELKLGSQYLQKILEDQVPVYFNKIFDATLESMFRLMTNSGGSCVIQKLHSLCDASHMEQIVNQITSRHDDLKNAAKNEAGANTLMNLISVLKSTNQHKSVLDSLTSKICVDILKSKPGRNLFESCLKDLDYSQNKILYDTAATDCIHLATDASGYAFLIALIKNNTRNPCKKALLLEIARYAVYFSPDPNGTYVIQATLLQDPEVDFMICINLSGTYLSLSKHTYASHVVQKCIMSGWRAYPILELIASGELHVLSKDQVGNYVVQKALTAARFEHDGFLYYELVSQILPYLRDLQHHRYGRYVFQLIQFSLSMYMLGEYLL